MDADLEAGLTWEHNHPGESIEDHLRRGGLLSRFSAAAALPQQMQSVLSDVAQALLLPGTVGSALGPGVLVRALRERRQSVRTLAVRSGASADDGVPVRTVSPAANGGDLGRASPVWVSPRPYGHGG